MDCGECFPTDILKYVIQPMLYQKNLLFKYFTGDPLSGYPILKDPWDSPHLSIIRQLKDAVELHEVDEYCFPHPLIISNKEKMQFAKDSLNTFGKGPGFNGQLRRKLTHKIFNKIKPKSLNTIIELIEDTFSKKVRYNRFLMLIQLKTKIEYRPYSFANDVCLGCQKPLPLYTPSIRKNWKRAVDSGYNPHMLLKRVCSRKCSKIEVFQCAACSKNCQPGTDFHLGDINDKSHNFFYIVQVNTDTGEASAPEAVHLPFTTNYACSSVCYQQLVDFGKNLNSRYLLIQNMNLEEPSGFLLNADIIAELSVRGYTVKSSVTILNPFVEEFRL